MIVDFDFHGEILACIEMPMPPRVGESIEIQNTTTYIQSVRYIYFEDEQRIGAICRIGD